MELTDSYLLVPLRFVLECDCLKGWTINERVRERVGERVRERVGERVIQ